MIFSGGIMNFMKAHPLVAKLVTAVLVMTLFTWVGIAYMALTTNVIDAMFKKKIDVHAIVKLDKSINDELDKIMIKSGSDRAALARFHDTVQDLTGNHFIYETRTNESVQPGVATAAGLRQTVLVSMISNWAQKFAENKCVFTTNLKQGDQFYEFYKEIGVKSDIKCPVNTASGNLVGFVYVEFTIKNVPPEELLKFEPSARVVADKIGALLGANGG